MLNPAINLLSLSHSVKHKPALNKKRSAIVVGHCDILLATTVKIISYNTIKRTRALAASVSQLDLINIYRTFCKAHMRFATVEDTCTITWLYTFKIKLSEVSF